MSVLLGKKVYIKDKKHPWYGHSGTCKEWKQMGVFRVMAYVVGLDNGMSCFAKDHQIKVVR